MKSCLINCDLGEGFGNETELMPYIQYCNIACGGHAGIIDSMNQVVDLAIKHEVKIGAHPSYPDSENFGRKSMKLSADELIETIQKQVNSLLEITRKKGAPLFHIKPHGALYNDIANNEEVANNYLKAITPFKVAVKLFVPYNSVIEKLALKNGFSIIYEAFADRNYNDDLSLVSRDNIKAVISSTVEVLKHTNEILNTGLVTTISNKKIKIKADTFCIHSDTENAVVLVKELYDSINPTK